MLESEKKELDAEIKSVIVYQQGVQITKLGSIHLTKGEQLICITNLPESLDKESVRVKGIGNGKIINITVEFNSKKEYKTEEYEKLNNQRDLVQKGIKKKDIELNRVNEQLEKFKSTESEFYDNWAKAFAFGEIDLSNFIEFNEKINENFKSKLDTTEKLEDRIKELRTELQVINNKISKLGPIEEVHNFYDVYINLNVVQEGEFKIELRFTMTEAWWVPFYDCAIGEEKAKLSMMANVYNRTGLDWEDIEIEISTASLKPISLIKPSPMILEEFIPYVEEKMKDYNFKGKKKMAAKPMGGALREITKSEDFDDDGFYEPEEAEYVAEEEPMPEIEETYAEVSENIGVQSFKIPNRIDIPSDKNPHPVNLTVVDLETEKKYYWSAVAPENVLIQDTVVNGDLLLLSGNVKIYFQEEFLGETSIPVIAPKEKFKLGTRVSYDLKIDKKLTDRSKAKKAIKGRLINNYEYKITIKNLNEATEDLTLYDKIPHSSSENIKVTIDEIVPEPDKKKLGVLTWKFNLKGLDDKTINYKYVVDYKKGIQITPSLP